MLLSCILFSLNKFLTFFPNLSKIGFNFLYRKPATHRGKRAILKKEPQLLETAKQALCIKGSTSSKLAHDCMKDFVSCTLIFM